MSSGFISEAELAEKRRVRQLEWEKVRRPDQPLEVPEEEYDPRSLYERLQEQKQKKDMEYEEAHRLKNMIKGLDDDEVEFLDLVDRSKEEEERKKTLEEEREMAEFRSKVATLQEQSLELRIQQEMKKPANKAPISSNRMSQAKLLAGAVKKKPLSDSSVPTDRSTGQKRPHSEDNTSAEASITPAKRPLESNENGEPKHRVGALELIGVLPGLGHYSADSSEEGDSDASTDFEDENLHHHSRPTGALQLAAAAANRKFKRKKTQEQE